GSAAPKSHRGLFRVAAQSVQWHHSRRNDHRFVPRLLSLRSSCPPIRSCQGGLPTVAASNKAGIADFAAWYPARIASSRCTVLFMSVISTLGVMSMSASSLSTPLIRQVCVRLALAMVVRKELPLRGGLLQ